MLSRYSVVSLAIAAALTASAQNSSSNPAQSRPAATQAQQSGAPQGTNATPEPGQAQTAANARQITVPAGTEVLLQLKNAIDTKSAHVGDGIYCQTTFPVVMDNIIIIPPGSYVKGEITKVQRAGRFSGRAEILFHFDSVIFPSGYTVEMPGNLHGDSGTHNGKVSDEEGTVRTEDHDKLKKLPDAGRDAGYGAIAGTIATGTLNGARIGGGLGGVAGLASIMLSRGADVRIEPGAALTMRLQRPLVVDVTATTTSAETHVVPRQTNTRLPIPGSTSKPQQ